MSSFFCWGSSLFTTGCGLLWWWKGAEQWEDFGWFELCHGSGVCRICKYLVLWIMPEMSLRCFPWCFRKFSVLGACWIIGCLSLRAFCCNPGMLIIFRMGTSQRAWEGILESTVEKEVRSDHKRSKYQAREYRLLSHRHWGAIKGGPTESYVSWYSF